MKGVAADFEKIINDGRERQKNQALAQKIFSKDRRQSAPSKTKLGAGPSLASRVGVKKQRASLGPIKPAGNINGEWTHDLHGTVNGGTGRNNTRRMDKRTELRAAKMADALQRTEAQERDIAIAKRRQPASAFASAPAPAPAAAPTKSLSIRGIAGPFAVMAQNFAPGTTAADIESAMTPIGGEMVSCNVMKTSPIMVVEMVFVSREGGEAVIEEFNNRTADGRIIKVYPKPGGYKEPVRVQGAPSAPRALRAAASGADGHVVDGSHGFDDLMDADETRHRDGKLYSDRLMDGGRRNWSHGRGRPGR